MNLTCTTSYCNPPANITWYLSSVDITSQSLSAIEKSGGLFRTVSSLLREVVKEDNGKQVYCRASNTLGEHVISSVQTVNVLCKWLNIWIMFGKGNLDGTTYVISYNDKGCFYLLKWVFITNFASTANFWFIYELKLQHAWMYTSVHISWGKFLCNKQLLKKSQ